MLHNSFAGASTAAVLPNRALLPSGVLLPSAGSLPSEILGWARAVVNRRRRYARQGRGRHRGYAGLHTPPGGAGAGGFGGGGALAADEKSGPANYLVLGRPVEHTHPGAMVDIGLGPTHGFSFRN